LLPSFFDNPTIKQGSTIPLLAEGLLTWANIISKQKFLHNNFKIMSVQSKRHVREPSERTYGKDSPGGLPA